MSFVFNTFVYLRFMSVEVGIIGYDEISADIVHAKGSG